MISDPLRPTSPLHRVHRKSSERAKRFTVSAADGGSTTVARMAAGVGSASARVAVGVGLQRLPTGLRLACGKPTVALLIATLVLMTAVLLPRQVFANALATASMNITDFGWYVDDGDGNPNDDRRVTISRNPGDSPDILLFNSDEEASVYASLTRNGAAVPGSPEQRTGTRVVSDTMPNALDLAPACVGAGCGAAPSGFGPVPNALPGSAGPEYVHADQRYTGFFADVLGGGPTGSATLGLRSDASLVTRPSAANGGLGGGGPADAAASQSVEFALAQRTFDSYFKIEFLAQTIARLGNSPGSASAQTSFVVDVDRFGDPGDFQWTPSNLSLLSSVAAADTDDPKGNSAGDTPTVLYSFDTLGAYKVIANEFYTIGFEAATSAQAQLAPAVPVPSAVWLFGVGLSGLIAVHARRRRCVCQCCV